MQPLAGNRWFIDTTVPATEHIPYFDHPPIRLHRPSVRRIIWPHHGQTEHSGPIRPGIQDRYAPANACFGCGPANEKGLQIKTFVEGDDFVAEFTPRKHHEAFDDVLCGGIIGTLLDCHMNWAAAFHLMELNCLDAPPCTVTAEYTVKMKAPTPTGGPLRLTAWILKSAADRAKVASQIEADGKITVSANGEFVAVEEGHPAFHRW
jgi:hypothetical protein